MFFRKRLKKFDPEKEQQLRNEIEENGGLEKGDGFAMVLSALLVFCLRRCWFSEFSLCWLGCSFRQKQKRFSEKKTFLFFSFPRGWFFFGERCVDWFGICA